MSKEQDFIIVGASLAGVSAAKALREDGFTGRIRLVGAEAHRPYIRPPLSKEYLAGSAKRSTVFVEADDWYAENQVEFRPSTRAVGLDPHEHRLTLENGEVLGWDRLLLATGSSPRRLAIPGAELDGVHYLRTLDDSEALRESLAAGDKRLVLIGSGWIGMEVAATARTLGNEVVILERDPIPLANALGDELGRMFAELHREHGVVLRTSVVVESIAGADGRLTGVVLAGGELVPADLVLVGVGAIPNVALAESAGLEIDNGILVDESLRTSHPDIYAAGDVANAYHPLAGMRLRSEHWANALHGGPVAARAMLGQTVSFDAIPYFYTDQFDLGMEYSGFGPLTRGADLIYRGNRESREFIAFWLNGGQVVAGMNVNLWDVNDQVQALIRRTTPINPRRLTDTAIPLNDV